MSLLLSISFQININYGLNIIFTSTSDGVLLKSSLLVTLQTFTLKSKQRKFITNAFDTDLSRGSYLFKNSFPTRTFVLI